MTDSAEFPFTRPDGSDLTMFIQWKGTDLCANFHCDCGYSGHVDGDFAYFVECGGCGAVYELGTQVIARRTTDADGEPTICFRDPATARQEDGADTILESVVPDGPPCPRCGMPTFKLMLEHDGDEFMWGHDCPPT